MKTLLITGGAGFIGSNFSHHLLEDSDEDILILNVDLLTYAGNLQNLSKWEQDSRYRFFKLSITDRAALVEQVFKPHSIDVIINFAAESHVDRSITDSGPFLTTNVIGTQVLMDCARDHDVSRFIQISTDEVYGSLGDTGSFKEDHSLKPNSPYAASKASADLLVLSYIRTFQFPAIIVRSSNNYGPYQFPEKLIPLMCTNAMEDIALPVYGKGENVRDWVHVSDFCQAIQQIADDGKLGEVYNVGGSAEWRNIDVVHHILKRLGKPESLIQFVSDRLGHDWRYAMDFSKLKTALGWSPKISFEAGLDDTIEWYANNQSWWQDIKSGDYQQYYQQQYKGRMGVTK